MYQPMCINNWTAIKRCVCYSSATARNKEPYVTCHNNTPFSFLTFSHPSIFSLFLSLLLGLESTLIREPRESAWLPVATAKDEKAGGGGGREWVSFNVLISFTPFCIEIDRQLYTCYYLWWSWVLLWKRRHPQSCHGEWQESLLQPFLRQHWGRLANPGSEADRRKCYLKLFFVQT